MKYFAAFVFTLSRQPARQGVGRSTRRAARRKRMNESKTENVTYIIYDGFFIARLTIPLYPIKKEIFGNIKKKCLYLYHKTERRCIYNVTENKTNVLFQSRKEIFGNIKKYLYICIKKIK